MQRLTIPMSQRQIVNLRYVGSLREVDEWLNDLLQVHEYLDKDPYYLHIDHVQVFPPNQDGYIPVLAIYHRVYLQAGF
jgi:hypothetical protein